MTNINLIAALTEASQELKAAYIEKTIESAKRMFAHQVRLSNIKGRSQEFFEYFNLPYSMQVDAYSGKTYVQPDRKLYHTKDMYRAEDKIRRACSIVNKGEEAFIADEVESANEHYTQSIAKLADRLQKKGFETFDSISSSRIGVNFECVIKHGEKQTRAFTIIAEGPIQRPHYRFLVK